MSEIKVNKVSPATGTAITLGDSGDTFTVPSGATIVNSGTATGFGGGKVLQCLSSTKTDTLTSTSTSFSIPSGLSVTLTPSATTSKVLILVSITGVFGRSGTVTCYAELYRDSTMLYDVGDHGSHHTDFITRNGAIHLDSPSSTSAIVYSCKMKGDGGQWTVNRDLAGTAARGYSSITAIEIGA